MRGEVLWTWREGHLRQREQRLAVAGAGRVQGYQVAVHECCRDKGREVAGTQLLWPWGAARWLRLFPPLVLIQPSGEGRTTLPILEGVDYSKPLSKVMHPRSHS